LAAAAGAVASSRRPDGADDESDFPNRGGNRRRERRSAPQARLDLRRADPLEHTVYRLQTELDLDDAAAWKMARELQAWTVLNEGEDRSGYKTLHWARKLTRCIQLHPTVGDKLFSEEGDVVEAVMELDRRSQRHSEVVNTIGNQHRAVRAGREDGTAEYTDASAYMGQSWWLKAVHVRVAKWIDHYYLLSAEQLRRGHPRWVHEEKSLPKGWQEYEVGGRVMFWNPETKRMQLKAPALEGQPRPEPRNPPVALLDIGSCTDPFSSFPLLVETTAVDLRPAEGFEGIFQADFFDVPIVEPGSESAPGAGERVLLGDSGELLGLVAGSFDVAVLSLVLSYVGSPEKRIEMISRARRCLRDDRGLLFVIEVGSAIASTSWYNEDAAAEWTRAIEAVGFRILRFEDQIFEKNRKHKVCQWVFETTEIGTDPLEPLRTPKEMPW